MKKSMKKNEKKTPKNLPKDPLGRKKVDKILAFLRTYPKIEGT